MPEQPNLTVQFRLTCVNPPPQQRDGQPTVFGLQDKQGKLHPGERQPDRSLVFDFDLQAKPGADGASNFLGPYAHGSVAERFLYLSYGYTNDSGQGWIRRLKIPLSSIRWEQVERAHANQSTFEGMVDGTGAARVRLLGGGWITA